MSSRWPAGIIRKTPITPAGPLQKGSAPGMWTLAEATYWQKQGLWPTQGLNSNWMGTQNTSYMRGSAVDSSGNFYAVSQSGTITKFGPLGNIIWVKTISTCALYDVTLDSAGNLYVCGGNTAAGSGQFYVAKVTSSGSISWQTVWSTTYGGQATGIVVAPSGNVYVVGLIFTISNYDALFVKLNSSGVVQFQRAGTSSAADRYTQLALDSSENVYIVGETGNSGTVNIQLIKYNSSGTSLSQTGFYAGSSGNLTSPLDIKIDQSTGDIYIAGAAGNGYRDIVLFKVNSSFTGQWMRRLGTNTSGFYHVAQRVAFDSSNNVYIAGWTMNPADIVVSGRRGWLIAKYNTSGTLQWQRSLGITSTDMECYGFSISGNNFLGVGMRSVSPQGFFMNAPTAGTLTNSYSINGETYVYGTPTLTDSTWSIVNSSYAMTNSTPTHTYGSSSNTITDASLTFNIVGMP